MFVKPAGQAKHRPAILSLILSIMALLMIGIASLLTREPQVVNNSGTAIEGAASKAAGYAFGSLFSLPLVIITFLLAGIAIILAMIKLRHAKITGVLSIILSVWALSVAVGVFRHIAAK